MKNVTTNSWAQAKNADMFNVMPFEQFFLGELLAEKIIDEELFHNALERLKKEKEKVEDLER